MIATDSAVLIERQGAVAVLSFNRPERLGEAEVDVYRFIDLSQTQATGERHEAWRQRRQV